MSGIRVLHVSQPTEAGVANVLLSQVIDQVRRGWQVHVACPADTGYLAVRAAAEDVVVHPWAATRSPGPSVIKEARSLRRIIRTVRPQVVVLHASKAGLVGRLVVRAQIPTVFMPHAWSFEAVTGAVAHASRGWEVLAAHWTTLDVLVSEAERQTGAGAGCLARQVVVIPNGVDVARWGMADRSTERRRLGIKASTPLVVLVGRLARQKGQDVALAGWPAVRAEVPDAELVLVGDGPDAEVLRDQLSPGARMVGSGDPQPWFAAADVVIMPSRWEGMPLVLLEALAAGRSVVATDVAGVREVLGDSGAVIRIGDANELASAITTRLKGPQLRAQEEVQNRAVVAERYDLTHSTARMAQEVSRVAQVPLA